MEIIAKKIKFDLLKNNTMAENKKVIKSAKHTCCLFFIDKHLEACKTRILRSALIRLWSQNPPESFWIELKTPFPKMFGSFLKCYRNLNFSFVSSSQSLFSIHKYKRFNWPTSMDLENLNKARVWWQQHIKRKSEENHFLRICVKIQDFTWSKVCGCLSMTLLHGVPYIFNRRQDLTAGRPGKLCLQSFALSYRDDHLLIGK